MTKEEFKLWCADYDLTPEQAAKVLGTSRAHAFKFANGSRPVSKPVALRCLRCNDRYSVKGKYPLNYRAYGYEILSCSSAIRYSRNDFNGR